jgi:demethylmenaquinone methyltransferase/2-methoxy-6-polyprenyl-1,4-benzoquinol methylase
MFSRIAPSYDLLNRLLSVGFDQRWRRRTAGLVAPRLTSSEFQALDLCCGTGDLALELARISRGKVVGADFASPMLVRTQRKAVEKKVSLLLLEADALNLPFKEDSFAVVTAEFGFRNLADYKRGLAEMLRVLTPGGEVDILEFALPRWQPFAGLYRFYFRHLLPLIGRLVSGVKGPYSYLPSSVERFPDCEEFSEWMRECGFVDVRYNLWTGGAVALHRGIKRSSRTV